MTLGFEVHESHISLWERKDWRYAILMGGRGNGRSGTASRFAVSQLLSKEYTRGAIMRAVREDIRASCWGDIKDRIKENGIENEFRSTENDMFIEHGKNSIRAHGFRASSGSLTARLKSLAGYNFIWIEEAEEIGEEEFRTLDDTLRTVKGRIRIVLTLNTPAKTHWIIQKWFETLQSDIKGFYRPVLKEEFKDTIFISGTWRENEVNLDPQSVERYKNYVRTNPEYYYQLIEGLSPETVLGKIYSGWKFIDEVPHEARLEGYGLDFGYDPDPAALIAVYYYNGGYILDEILYSTGIDNPTLAKTLKNLPNALTIADSAEPKSIQEIRNFGINIIGADKGKESVRYGVKTVQVQRISVTKRSINVKKEYDNFAQKYDKKTGNAIMGEYEGTRHALDAVRYKICSMIPIIQRKEMIAAMPKFPDMPWVNPAV